MYQPGFERRKKLRKFATGRMAEVETPVFSWEF